jgi:Rad3-related DNA helicase
VSKPRFKLSVGALVQRTQQTGDIHFRFSSRSNAAEGIRGHQKLQKQRGESYEAEVTVADIISFDSFVLELGGRADGCALTDDGLLVEEIKTLKVDVDRLPDQVTRLHWAQVRIYGYLLGKQRQAEDSSLNDAIILRLTYYHLDQHQEYSFDDVRTIAELEKEYHAILDQYGQFMTEQLRWEAARDVSIREMEMPFGEFRSGQRELAVSVYRAMAAEGQLVLQAPTVIGKTMGTLFPAVKAMEDQAYRKLFYLSAKGSAQQMARTAIDHMRGAALKLRDVTVTAKDKICFNPGTPCDPEYCQYARGYFDKLPAVIHEVHQQDVSFAKQEVEALASKHGMCPFELGLDLTDIADVVIGDYNYVFDPTVYLRRHFDDPDKLALLMDESHNLVDRGRDMFSASLDKGAVLELKKLIGDSAPTLKKALTAVNREMLDASRDVSGEVNLQEFPSALERARSRFVQAAESWMDEHQGSQYHGELLQFYFDTLRFLRVNEQADKDYACIVTKLKKRISFKWYCVNPSSRLAEGFDRVSSSVCFSATLTPQVYYRSLLGLQDDSQWYQLPSPFNPENLGVFSTSFLSTTYHNREASLYDLVDTLAAVTHAKRGNYIVYFPSYAYLNMVYDKFQERHPGLNLRCQQPSMGEAERAEFLDAFSEGHVPVVGFAVMGGIFGEGVDLTGQKLIGVVVVGVGLPQINIERDLIRDYFDADGQGFEFAYQFPGMVRVLQTAGRVIRTEQDRGGGVSH